MTNQNYRLYCLTNSYLSSLQKGLQTAHVVSEIYSCATELPHEKKVFDQWADQDRTIIILNGGNCASLEDFRGFLIYSNCRWPWAAFYEDKQSLNGAITAVGVIVPESVYQQGGLDEQAADMALASKLQSLPLAV